jgi:hypothetical protein
MHPKRTTPYLKRFCIADVVQANSLRATKANDCRAQTRSEEGMSAFLAPTALFVVAHVGIIAIAMQLYGAD